MDVFPAGMTKVEQQRMRRVVSANFPQLDMYMNTNNLVPQVQILKVTSDNLSDGSHDVHSNQTWAYRSLTPIQEDDNEFESPNQVVVSKKSRKAHKKRGSRVSPALQKQPAQNSERCIIM